MWALALALTLLFTASASGGVLKVATWNIEHLRDAIGEGPNARTQEDFDRLAKYAEILDANVIALQEIENLEAAARVFDPAKYQLFIERRDGALRTGFAVRKGIPLRPARDDIGPHVR